MNRTIPKGGDHVTILICGVHCFTDKKVPISFHQLFSLFSWDVSMKPGLFLEIFATNYFVLAIIKNYLISYLFELCEFISATLFFPAAEQTYFFLSRCRVSTVRNIECSKIMGSLLSTNSLFLIQGIFLFQS